MEGVREGDVVGEEVDSLGGNGVCLAGERKSVMVVIMMVYGFLSGEMW